MKPVDPPPHAYVPGQTPRHAEGAFDALRHTVAEGSSDSELLATPAVRTGLAWMDLGYFWEAHELLEPAWMQARPNSRVRRFLKAAIQTANAGLKDRMGRGRAVVRLCREVRGLLAGLEESEVGAEDLALLDRHLARLEKMHPIP